MLAPDRGRAGSAQASRYALLTGETRDRSAQVAAFQQGAVPIFLISLKAGGVGLNLTAADTVIHYDPWWNPAAENQATDRAWRIGQDKPVFVYKLIAKGTLEEKIQLLQQKKSELAQSILAEGESQKMALTQEDLQAIFAPLEDLRYARRCARHYARHDCPASAANDVDIGRHMYMRAQSNDVESAVLCKLLNRALYFFTEIN